MKLLSTTWRKAESNQSETTVNATISHFVKKESAIFRDIVLFLSRRERQLLLNTRVTLFTTPLP
jgi:hypothetical protein